MVAAFEQSLSSMTNRLQQLSSSSELKDCELDRLRKTIETLKQQGGSLVSGCRSFSSVRHGSMPGSYTNGSSDCESTNTIQHSRSNLTLIRRHTFNNALINSHPNPYPIRHDPFHGIVTNQSDQKNYYLISN